MTFPAGHTTPHLVNLAVHVVFGSAALLLGIAAIITAKGGPIPPASWALVSLQHQCRAGHSAHRASSVRFQSFLIRGHAA